MKKITPDAGHGLTTGGKQAPKGVKEWTLNNAVCRHIAAILAEYGVEVIRVDEIPRVTRTCL